MLAETDWNPSIILRVVQDDLVKLAPVTIKHRRFGVPLGSLLMKHHLARIPSMYTKAILAQVDAEVRQLHWGTYPSDRRSTPYQPQRI